MKTVSFSFATEEERAEFTEYARQKGMTLSALAKMAIYQYRAKYPAKCGKKELFVPYSENKDETSKTVRPYAHGANEGEEQT
jgi:hypothetical protein